MTEKRFTHKKWYNERQLFDGEEPFAIVDVYNQAEKICDKLNEIVDENKKLKRENESLNSQLIRLDKELFCQDCLTCRHSKSIDITVRCANGNGITDYQMNCDFYEIDEEWVE